MTDIAKFNRKPVIRERKRITHCPQCDGTHFKLVAYERNFKAVYLECSMCETALSAEEEIQDIKSMADSDGP